MPLQLKRRRARVEIIPMIDVMFFMLVFFMLFSTFKSGQTGVEINLPKALHIGAVKQNTVVISVDKESRIFFGKEPLTLEELKPRISSELEKDRQTQVIIKPDALAPYGTLVRVMDSLAETGVERPLWGVDRQQLPKAKTEIN